MEWSLKRMPCSSPVISSLSILARRLTCAAAITTLAMVVGCSDQPRPYPVNGQVLFTDGQPLSGGRIEVRSLEHPLVARASIGRDGKFTLTTFKADDGAVAGKHEVLIVQKFTADIDSMAEHARHADRMRTLDPRFSKYKTSGLTMDVERGGIQDVVLQVTSE